MAEITAIVLTEETIEDVHFRTGISERALYAKWIANYWHHRRFVVYFFREDGGWSYSHTSSRQ